MTVDPRARTRSISILGATGSVGRSTLDLLSQERAAHGEDALALEAVTAATNVEALIDICHTYRPAFAAIADETKLEALRAGVSDLSIETGAGAHAITEAAQRPADWVMAAIVGAAGLKPTLAAAERGARVAIANKECLVCAGDLFMAAAKRAGATLLPVDSEHNAIFQVFDRDHPDRIDKLILTASGGPFRTADRSVMAAAGPEQAVNHPVWSMGAKISVDSATMMNKGLELIEAHYLFDMPSRKLDVVVHPQSVIHSMVEYVDGSVLAQLGTPDMRIPIAYALAWPDRMSTPSARLSLAEIGQLSFEAPDLERFPALALARTALEAGGAAPAALNAANEIAVAAFLDRRIGFLDIAAIVGEVLERALGGTGGWSAPESFEDVFALDAYARTGAKAELERRAI
ncbi:MAG: 1-deoxy-D-xylulose-5-phosphate reductoisomerase [Maricaulaceae bacterium]